MAHLSAFVADIRYKKDDPALCRNIKPGRDNMDDLQELRMIVAAKLVAEEQMPVESDAEYYFIYGQLVYYFCSKMRREELAQETWRNKFDNARVPSAQKETLRRLMVDRGEFVSLENTKLKRMISMFYGYAPDKMLHHDGAGRAYSYGFTVETVI